MKKTLLLLFTALVGGVSVANAQVQFSIGTEQSTKGDWSYGWDVGPKVSLYFTNQWGEYKVQKDAFNKTDYPKYKLTLASAVAASSVQIKIDYATEAEASIELVADKLVYEGSFTDNVTYVAIQGKVADASVEIASFVLLDGSDNETAGKYATNWGTKVLGGIFTSTSNYGALVLHGTEGETIQDITITANSALPEEIQFKTHYTDPAGDGYPSITTGGLTSTTRISKPFDYLVLMANNKTGVVVDIKSITGQVYRQAAFGAGKQYISYASDKDLDFSGVTGLEAYTVSALTSSSATLTKINEAPAGTGLILKGAAGETYNVPVKASASAVGTNKLQAAVTATDVTANSAYVLSDGQFKKFSGTSIPAGKAYLLASDITGGAHELALVFGDDVTAIKNIKVGTEDNVYYDLQGRRVLYPTKGLYIVNGKKVILK